MPRTPITRANPYTPKRGGLAGQTFRSERQYRNALARRKGYSSWHAQQRAAHAIRSASDFARLDPYERLARRQAFEALTDMRAGASLARAARRARTTPNAVLRHVGAALDQAPNGRWHARVGDRLYRRMQVLGEDGLRTVEIRGSRAASRLSAHANAVREYIYTGDPSKLERFRGMRVGGVELETDLDRIDEWARRGELSFEDIYAGLT
ncbi:MAG: hypothetical protein ACRDLE_02960 [Gaiellaceae bacterium]